MLRRCMSGSAGVFLFVFIALCLRSSAQDVDECNVPLTAQGTSGLLSRVVDFKATIGYAGLDSVLRAKSDEDEFDTCVLHVAHMKNKWGRVVAPSADGAQAAVRSRAAAFLDSSCPGFGLCAEVYDGPDADVWPISTLTYLVVPTNTTEEEEGCDKMKTVYDYVKWILTDATAADIAKEQAMATMPSIIAEQALAMLDQMQCRDADGVARLVKDRATRAESLEGGGSSLQGGLQTKLTNAYFQQTFTSIAYTASSSGTGRAALRNFEVHFAGSDSILDMADPEFSRRQVKMIPAFAAAVALVYNLDGADGLVLTREAVAGIFSGSVTSWSNAAIRLHNPDALLTSDVVVRVVRESKSGTTSALTKAIYSFAGLPGGAQLDYSLHPLGGSSLPDWPVPALPYADGAVCNLRSCIKQVCEPGQRLDLAAEACLPCPQGYYSEERGQREECDACPPGSYTNSEGNAKCAKCDEFQYQDERGARACKQCPANTRRFFVDVEVGGAVVQQDTAGESVGECKCEAGFWLPAAVNHTSLGGAPCHRCPDGATCPGFSSSSQQIPVPKQDYWGDPLHPGRFIECSTKACRGSYQCEAGRTGRLCAAPEEGHFALGRLWTPRCPASGSGRTALVVCSLAALLAFWCKLRTLCNSNLDAVAVVVGILQAFFVISRMPLRWHPSIEAATAVLAVFNFDAGFVGWHCALAGWDGASAFYLQLCLPFILTALSAGGYQLRWMVEARASSCAHDKNVRAKAVIRHPNYLPDDGATFVLGRCLSFLLSMYHTLVMYAIAPFVCDSEPDGRTEYVALMPEVQCHSAAHKGMRIAAILYILLVLIPVPLYLASRLRAGLKQDVLNVYGFMEQFGFLYLKFHVHLPWWELVLVARKGLLAVVLATVQVPMLQAVLAILVVNGGLCLQLAYAPLVDRHAHRLEVAGLFATLILAVCGMLFFPSLDKSVECVGTANLVASVGEQCAANERLKADVAALLLLLLALLGFFAVAVSAKEVRARARSELAALHMQDMLSSRRRRQVGRAVGVGEEEGVEEEEGQGEGSAGSVGSEGRRGAEEESWRAVWHTPSCWRGLACRLGLRKEVAGTEAEGVADRYTLRLCHMVQGARLYWWEQRMLLLDTSSRARWDRVRSHVRLHQEELAYMETDEALSKFATIFDHVSGFYVNDGFANKLRQISELLPLLIDWLAHASPELRHDLFVAIQSLTIFCRQHFSRAVHDVVMAEYRAPVVHWLTRCTEEQRHSFRTVFAAIASSSGLGAGKLADVGQGAAAYDGKSCGGPFSSCGTPFTLVRPSRVSPAPTSPSVLTSSASKLRSDTVAQEASDQHSVPDPPTQIPLLHPHPQPTSADLISDPEQQIM